jgi:hypothetical protein
MFSTSKISFFVKRFLISFLISLAFVVLLSEIAFRFQKDKVARAPDIITLVIPTGTADSVANGDPVPSIPAEMDFLTGDVLTVVNEDNVDHQLGPVWVPPGTSASLRLDQAEKFAYSCSFQPSRYLGINVRQPTTLTTRLTGLGLAVPPTTMVLFLYSILLIPVDGKKKASAEDVSGKSDTEPDSSPSEAGV